MTVDKKKDLSKAKVTMHPESRLIKFGLNDDYMNDDILKVNNNELKLYNKININISKNTNNNISNIPHSDLQGNPHSNTNTNTNPKLTQNNSLDNHDAHVKPNMSPIDDDNESPNDLTMETDTVPKKVRTGPKKKVSWAINLSTDSYFLKDEAPDQINMAIEEVEKIQEKIRENEIKNSEGGMNKDKSENNNSNVNQPQNLMNLQQSSNQQFINFQSKIFNLQSINNFEKNLYKNSKDYKNNMSEEEKRQ